MQLIGHFDSTACVLRVSLSAVVRRTAVSLFLCSLFNFSAVDMYMIHLISIMIRLIVLTKDVSFGIM